MKTARVGLTSSDIDFLRAIYKREPEGHGPTTLDYMRRSLTPQLSARMQEDMHKSLSNETVERELLKRLPQRIRQRTPPARKRLIAGKLVETHPAVNDELAEAEETAYVVAPTSRSQLARTGRSLLSNREAEKQASARASARSSARASARPSQRQSNRASNRASNRMSERIEGETARLSRQKADLQEQLFDLSIKLKAALSKPEPDAAMTKECIDGDAALEKYDRDAGYRSFNRQRYSTEQKTMLPQECFDRPFTPKGFLPMTEIGKYSVALAKNRQSLCDRQYSTW